MSAKLSLSLFAIFWSELIENGKRAKCPQSVAKVSLCLLEKTSFVRYPFYEEWFQVAMCKERVSRALAILSREENSSSRAF